MLINLKFGFSKFYYLQLLKKFHITFGLYIFVFMYYKVFIFDL